MNMKVSTKGRYALRLLIDIAINGKEKPVSLKEVSERQNISMKYLEQIILMLNDAGYLKSVRGPKGGYNLLKDPSEITVGDVLRITEGSIAPVECVCSESCDRKDICKTYGLWNEIDQAVEQIVDHRTIKDLL